MMLVYILLVYFHCLDIKFLISDAIGKETA